MAVTKQRTPHRLGSIFFLPAAIAVLSIAGLLLALIGDGIWDAASWVILSVPIVVVVWFACQPKGR